MSPRGPRPVDVGLSAEERAELTRWARRAKTAQYLALRAKIVLRCVEGGTNKETAAELGVAHATVNRWRSRFIRLRLDGLTDEPRPGRPPSILLDQVEDVLTATLESTAGKDTHWSRASMAKSSGLSRSTIGRIWTRFDLKPHLQDAFKLSTDPLFVEKAVDVVGLYHHPPEKAVVLCVDEKSQIQALDRSQPVLPMMPGMPGRRTHDYCRHGITSLFAAFNIADGTVISELHRRHRAIEFKKFLIRIDKAVPTGLDVHLVCDNYATHHTAEIRTWLGKHPRFHIHFTPSRPRGLRSTKPRTRHPLPDQLTLHLSEDHRVPVAQSGPCCRRTELDPQSRTFLRPHLSGHVRLALDYLEAVLEPVAGAADRDDAVDLSDAAVSICLPQGRVFTDEAWSAA
ncbi:MULTISPECIES: IS630 family transposase [unclassified Streptomyces]|uniref:IS630 family transposase n=1 Tax=unclassified Streptomyces TaxID=2593676 RepID=UPI003082DDBF